MKGRKTEALGESCGAHGSRKVAMSPLLREHLRAVSRKYVSPEVGLAAKPGLPPVLNGAIGGGRSPWWLGGQNSDKHIRTLGEIGRARDHNGWAHFGLDGSGQHADHDSRRASIYVLRLCCIKPSQGSSPKISEIFLRPGIGPVNLTA